MTDSSQVDPDRLRRHAIAVDEVTVQVSRALDAATHVRLGDSAYGQLCQFVPALLSPLHDTADQVLVHTRDALRESGQAVRDAAAAYQDNDAAAASAFGRMSR